METQFIVFNGWHGDRVYMNPANIVSVETTDVSVWIHGEGGVVYRITSPDRHKIVEFLEERKAIDITRSE